MAGAADFPLLRELFVASIGELAAGDYDVVQRQAWAAGAGERQGWEVRLGGLRVLLAEAGATCCGFIAYAADGHIDLLYTHPAAARQGVASALYAKAEAELAAAGVRELHTEASLTARPFFARHGFRVLAEETVQRDGVTLRRWRMRKSLTRRGYD